ncbi:PIN domain-containing protein [Burkholderia lata]|uniref:PIN domain-containing protein n=1 Tax=Burkholderia lata (strain ATCC 17760 / DSM 23089 / LMG 22485 / NCIMB 9086 / R18194 / 383) TaxID=482957 RepID=UPI001453E298|nr:PIN domain-containing protein [Burkholderia lata]VWM09573.1 hypothetical protein BLA6992_03575 [Burkholderia lata]
MNGKSTAGVPCLHLVLDTNILYDEGSGDCFFSPSIKKVIVDKAYKNLNVRWIIPRMVRLEREYHLREKAKHIISKANKDLPSILADNWIKDTEKVHAAISSHAQSEIDELGVTVRECMPDKVDWNRIMECSGLRLPPFDPNEKAEKGFKDAIVAETFVQIQDEISEFVHDSAILVTKDEMLADHVGARIDSQRCKVLRSIGALLSELNFLIADIDAEQANELLRLAEEALYADSKFWPSVIKSISDYLFNPQSVFGISDIKNLDPNYQPNIFLRKNMQTVYFSCRLTYPRTGKIWMFDIPQNAKLYTLGSASGLSENPAFPNYLSNVSVYPNERQATLPIWSTQQNVQPQLDVTPATFVPLPEESMPKMAGLPTFPGHYEEVPVSPLEFVVEWSANYSIETIDGTKTLRLGTPHLVAVEKV